MTGIRRTVKGLLIGSSGRQVCFKAGSVAAAGTNSQANSGALLYPVNNVTGADASTKGVRLPVPKGNAVVYVYNAVATAGCQVFPHTDGTINGGTANASITMEGKTLAIFVCVDGTNWAAMYTAN
jgi:hypothetical protein